MTALVRQQALDAFDDFLVQLVRELAGGPWTLPLDDEKDVNFNKPVITGHGAKAHLEFAPINTMRAYALRR